MTKENQQPITGCGTGDIADYAFVCGDPARVPKITAQWDDCQEVCRTREYVIVTGTYKGVLMTAASTGIGAPSTAVIIEELAKLGTHTFIRIGNSGAIAEAVELGDYVITTGSIRDEGTTKSYVRPDYPAAANYEVVSALVDAAKSAEVNIHTGVTWSIDAFYARNKVLMGGEMASMCFGGYEQSGQSDMLADAAKAGVKNIEMESSTVLTLASLFGLRAGCICTVSDRAPWPGPGDFLDMDRNMDGAIQVALDAVLALASKD